MEESLFTICNLLVVPAWLLLIFAPRWRWSAALAAIVGPLLLGLVYIGLIAFNLPSLAGFTRLEGISRMFDAPLLLLAGWVHYLAMDLFVGAWQVRDSLQLGVPRLLVIPCLLLTFLFGPAGLVCYLVLREFLKHRRAMQSHVGELQPCSLS